LQHIYKQLMQNIRHNNINGARINDIDEVEMFMSARVREKKF